MPITRSDIREQKRSYSHKHKHALYVGLYNRKTIVINIYGYIRKQSIAYHSKVLSNLTVTLGY